MLRKIVLFFAVMLIPVIATASGDIGKDSSTYKDIRSLVDSGVITKPLTQDSLSREEVVEYINDGVHNVLAANRPAPQAASQASDAELAGQIGKLYNLVKEYMTDMMKTQQKLDSILETIGDLKVKKEEMEKRQEKLLGLMGMRIDGESNAYMTDLLLYGSKFQYAGATDDRYRPITQYLDLKFSLNATKELYAEATFRVENMYGGFWGSDDIYGLRRFFIQGQYPISFVFGDYQAKLTPFTLWAVDDDRPFESRIFSDKRDMNKNELYLLDDTWPLSGGKIQTIATIADAVDVNITFMGARLGVNGQNDYTVYDPTYNSFVPQLMAHDQFLVAGRIDSSLSLPDNLDIGFNYSEIEDDRDTGDNYNAPTVDNPVYSADAAFKLKFGDGMDAKISGEFAKSLYTNNAGINGYISDTAMKAGVEVNAFNTKVTASFIDVGNSFTSYAAQTRIFDERSSDQFSTFLNNDLYLTQNNTWNIAGAPPQYIIGTKIYPFTKYNPTINVSYGLNPNSSASGLASVPGNLLFYPQYENNISPYGDATPNRQKISVMLSGDYDFGFVLKPLVSYDMASEIVPYSGIDLLGNPQTIAVRNFSVIRVGTKAEYGMFAATVGYTMEDTNNNSTVAYSSAIIDAGLEATLIKKKLKVYAGYKHIDFNGTEYAATTTNIGGVTIPVYAMLVDTDSKGTIALPGVDQSVDSMGVGVEYYIAKPAIVGLSFTNTTIEDNKIKTNSFGAQELDLRVSIKF
jgi:hypothetical protein